MFAHEGNCEACGRPSTDENPAHEHQSGALYHDDCAQELGIPEGEML